jgi:hypothetical protein
MDAKSFIINLLFYFFTFFVSYILISTFKSFLVLVGTIILIGSIIGVLILVNNYFKNKI